MSELPFSITPSSTADIIWQPQFSGNAPPPPGIGHNRSTFDEIVADNLRRGLYLTQRDVLISCIRDERLAQRHRLVLAAIIEHMNARDGMAYPGRRALAQSTSYYDHGWIERNYTEAGVSKTISELIDFGYLAIARRAPQGGKRALSHYTIVRRSSEELQAEISDYIEKIRRDGPKRVPEFQKDIADLTPGRKFTPVGNDSEAVLTPVVPAALTPVSPTVTSIGTRSEVSDATAVAEPKKPRRKSQLPADWHPSETQIAWVKEGWAATDQQIAGQAELFRNYHIGKGSLMADWNATWRTWWLNGYHKVPQLQSDGSGRPLHDKPKFDLSKMKRI